MHAGQAKRLSLNWVNYYTNNRPHVIYTDISSSDNKNLVLCQLTELVWRSDWQTFQTRPGLSTLCQSRKRKPTCKQTLQRQVRENDPAPPQKTTKMHTFPTHANNCKLRGESSVLSQNSELSSELKANTNSPERQEEKLR